MNKIEKLIEEMCPQGVEFKKLGKITSSIKTGLNPRQNFTLNTADATNFYVTVKEITTGKIKFSEKTDKINDNAVKTIQNRSDLMIGDVLFSGIGTIGKVALVNIPTDNWNCSESIFIIKPRQEVILPKFLMYILGSDVAKDQYRGQSVGSTLKGVRMATLSSIQIPTPPLTIQKEIVKILDNFTQLEAELEAELEARKKQYEHYREELLTFGDDVEWSTLGRICNNVSSGGTPLSTKKDYYGGDIPWLRTQEVRFIDIYDTNLKITEQGLAESSAKWIPANCVIVAISGATAARTAINKIPLTTNQHCCNLEINPEIGDYRYVFHWVSSQYKELKELGRGARSDLNSGIIKQFPLPIPPLSKQKEIVAILDKFDALVNDISTGLPAEIAARKKQYEYYRNQLLTFKPLEPQDVN